MQIMKYQVNENCIGCGLCIGICPNVFQMSDEGVAKAFVDEVSEENMADAGEAAQSCPVAAIEEA